MSNPTQTGAWRALQTHYEKIKDVHLRRECPCCQAADYCNTKAVITEQRIAKTGDQGFAWHTQRSAEV